MTDHLTGVDLPRPAPAADAGPLDERFYDLVEARVRRVLASNPVLATHLGIHTEDHRLGDASHDAVQGEIAADRAHLAAVEGMDATALSAGVRFERDLELHNLRLGLFEQDEVRQWERRTTAAGELGDAVFLLFARGAAPEAERIARIADRLEQAPAFLEASHTRAVGPQVGLWQQVERRYTADLPDLFDDVCTRATSVLDERELARLGRAIDGANAALEAHGAWLVRTLDGGTDGWPLGRDRYDELVRLRGFGDLDADAILEIGWDQLRSNLDARRAAAREIDPDADLPTVIERLKHDHPSNFEGALEAYRDAMHRARRAPAGPRPGHDPGRRGHRGHRDPRVPAVRDAVRRLLRAGPLRRGQARHLHRHARGGRRPERDARALLRRDLEHQRPRGLPWPSPAARGRLGAPLADPHAHRRPGVRGGVGHVLRADDARGGLRRRPRRSGRPCTQTPSGERAGSSSTCGCTAAS